MKREVKNLFEKELLEINLKIISIMNLKSEFIRLPILILQIKSSNN